MKLYNILVHECAAKQPTLTIMLFFINVFYIIIVIIVIIIIVISFRACLCIIPFRCSMAFI